MIHVNVFLQTETIWPCNVNMAFGCNFHLAMTDRFIEHIYITKWSLKH